MGTAIAIKLALDLALSLMVAYPEARRNLTDIAEKLRSFEGHDPSDAEWDEALALVKDFSNYAIRRGEEAEEHLAMLKARNF